MYNDFMNHHRLGVTALVLLIILTIIYARWLTYSVEPTDMTIASAPFGGMVPSEITHGNRDKKQIIFTFDGGEGAQSASAVLDTLHKHNSRGTFFLTGKWVMRNPDLVQRMRREGHEVYNHSLSHPHLPLLSDQRIMLQLETMDETLLRLVGTSTKPYFRPPYGDRDARVLATAARAGYRSVMWTVDAGDWMESEGFTADEVRGRIFGNIEPGAIILMHLGDTITGSILDDVFTQIEARGYALASLSQGLAGVE